MFKRLAPGPILLILGTLGLVLLVGLLRASPMVITLTAVSILMLLLTFVIPELTLHVVVLSMLLSPEVALMQLGGVAGGHDMLTLRLEDFMLLFLGFSMLARIAIMKELGDLARSPLNRPIVAYFAVCTIATLMGVVKGYVAPVSGFFYLLKFFEYFFIYYMVFTTVHEEQQAKRLLVTFFVTAFCVIVYGFWQIPAGDRISAPFEGSATPEPNTLGGYLVLVIAVSLGFLAEGRGYFRRTAWTVFILLAIVALLYTLSRASWVAMVPLLLLFVSLYRRHLPLIAFAIPAIGVSWLILTPADLKQRVQQRIEETFVPEAGNVDYTYLVGVAVDSSTSGRITNFVNAVSQLPKDPLLGRGVSGWGLADTHWARLIGETGVAGIVAFLWLIYSLLRQASRIRSWALEHAPQWRGLVSGYLLGIAGVLGHSLGTETFLIVRIMEPFWFVTALVFVLPKLYPAEEPAAAAPEDHPAAREASLVQHASFSRTLNDRP